MLARMRMLALLRNSVPGGGLLWQRGAWVRRRPSMESEVRQHLGGVKPDSQGPVLLLLLLMSPSSPLSPLLRLSNLGWRVGRASDQRRPKEHLSCPEPTRVPSGARGQFGRSFYPRWLKKRSSLIGADLGATENG